MRRAPFMFALVLVPGCYLSHGSVEGHPVRDAGVVPVLDSGPESGSACVFSFESPPAGGRVECTIELASRSGCLDAARCVCAARIASGSTTDLDACVAGERTPRDATITFSDFCTEAPPAHRTMSEALEGYLRYESSIVISPACSAIPAVFGS